MHVSSCCQPSKGFISGGGGGGGGGGFKYTLKYACSYSFAKQGIKAPNISMNGIADIIWSICGPVQPYCTCLQWFIRLPYMLQYKYHYFCRLLYIAGPVGKKKPKPQKPLGTVGPVLDLAGLPLLLDQAGHHVSTCRPSMTPQVGISYNTYIYFAYIRDIYEAGGQHDHTCSDSVIQV